MNSSNIPAFDSLSILAVITIFMIELKLKGGEILLEQFRVLEKNPKPFHIIPV